MRDTLDLESLGTQELVDKVKELHESLVTNILHCYDLEEQLKKLEYDFVELQERAKQQSNKSGQGKRDRSMSVTATPDKFSEKFPQAPPRVELCSKFERKTDSRSYDQRRTLYAGQISKAPVPGLPLALVDKELDMQLWMNNRNIVTYDRIRLRMHNGLSTANQSGSNQASLRAVEEE